MKRVVYLVVAALVAMMILVPTAMAQDYKEEKVTKMEVTEEKIPKTGGPAAGSVLLPAGALLLGSGIVAYAVLRRR